jgi:FMN-dependent NADH-azoreductase
VTAEGGYEGLIPDKPVFIAYWRGGAYPPGTDSEAFDVQAKYLESSLGFMGLRNIRRVIIEPTPGGPDLAKEKREGEVLNLVKKFVVHHIGFLARI